MLDSQILSSFLCVGFLFSSFNGFVITSNQKKLIESNAAFQDIARRDSQPQSRTGRRYTSYFSIKAKSKAPKTAVRSTSSDKIQEMAAFLSIQLMQKVITESMKPEGESNIDLKAVERLTKALQMSDSQPLSEDPSSEVSATMPGDTEDTAKLSETPTTKYAPIKDHNKSAPPENLEKKSNEADLSNIKAEFSTSTPTDLQTEAKIKKEVKDQSVAPARISSSQQVPEVIRSPLEIIQSNIPPLRPESVPRKTPEIAEAETPQPLIRATEEEEATAIKSENKEDTVGSPKISADILSNSKDVLERQKAEESFQRRLLKQRIEYDRIQTNTQGIEGDGNLVDETESNTKYSPLTENNSDKESGNDGDDSLISMGIDAATQFKSTETAETDTKSSATDFPEQAESNKKTKGEDEESNKVEPHAPDLTNQRSSSLISERRIETIVARRQPKSSEEEMKLAAKYAEMEKLQDRAYVLLCDLGMIEEHQDPRDPSYDHSKDDEYCEQRFLPPL